jgi:hypothetical protein
VKAQTPPTPAQLPQGVGVQGFVKF